MKYPDFLVQQIEEALVRFPDVPTRTLAKRLFNQNPKFFKNIEQARTAIRYRRGNLGEGARKYAKFPREGDKAGWSPDLPPSVAEPWGPVKLEYPNRIAIVSDVHIPYQDNNALQRWYEAAQEYEPNVILLNGDILDFYRLSRFEKDPNKRDTAFEIDCCHDFLDWLQEGFEADIIYKEGNHDERWRKYIWNHAPEFARLDGFQLDRMLELEDRGIQFVTDQRPVECGDVVILHGHELQGSGGGVNPARLLAMKMRHNTIQSHCHRSSQYTERNAMGEWLRCWSTGCMCELNPEFSRVNRWCRGYGFLDVYEDGSFDFDNIELDD